VTQTGSRSPADVERLQRTAHALEREVATVIVGHQDVVRGVTIALLAGGHVLLEGLPGLGKTLLVRTVARAVSLEYSRIQFTPDLMPADVTGTNVLMPTSSAVDGAARGPVEGSATSDGPGGFHFQPGPVFANLVLADEINRATPRTQSALLEAMQEHAVTVGRTSHKLPEPFFVLATQNPIELEGTYPLPEAELDRFFFKLAVGFPSRPDLGEIVRRTTGPAATAPAVVANAANVLELQELVREVPVASHVADYAVRLVLATHPELPEGLERARRSVRYGASPRAAQALVLASKVNALLGQRLNVSFDDVRRVALPVLRHRLVLTYEADARGETADAVINDLLIQVRESS
jgi:MoxR-like ATPase